MDIIVLLAVVLALILCCALVTALFCNAGLIAMCFVFVGVL